MDPVTMGLMMGGGQLLSGIGGMFSGQTQAGANRAAGQMGLLGSILAGQAAEQGFGRAQAALSPYATAGNKSLDLLMSYLTGNAAQKAGVGGGGPNLLSTFAPTQAQLESTPGYQWAREQALGGMANTGAARGMGLSGNVIQDIGKTATGLASQTFQQQLQNYMTQNQQAYNMLFGPAQMGMGAAGGIANAAMDASRLIGGAATGAGNAFGAGIMGAGNALAGGTQSMFGGAGKMLSTPAQTAYSAAMNPMFNQGVNYAGIPELLKWGTGGGGPFPSTYNPIA